MMILHDTLPPMMDSTLTERGQVSVPAALRKNMELRPGARFHWEQVSNYEFRVNVEPPQKIPGPMAMLGYARVQFPKRPPRTTAEVMREIRDGEDA